MGFSKKIIIFLVIIFALGISAGFYLGNKGKQGNVKLIRMADNGDKAVSGTATGNIDSAKLKLDLLKSYTDLVLLSPEKITDATKYADNIKKELEAINDAEITSRFEDTLVGDDSAKSQKVNDFLDFLNDKIRADLQ